MHRSSCLMVQQRCQTIWIDRQLKKTEAMCQSYPPHQTASASITAGSDGALKSVDKFCYVGSFLSNTISADGDITSRLAKACSAFGKLQRRLRVVHDVSLKTKIAVYRAVVLTTVLYGSEIWLYRRSNRRLDHFDLRCLSKIARVKWQDRIANTDVLNICGIMGTEAFLLKAQLLLVDHIRRMSDSCILKQVFLGQLAVEKRLQCGPVLRYKDALKVNMKQCNKDSSTPSGDTQDRSVCRALCREAVGRFEDSRIEALEHRRAVRKGGSTSQQPQRLVMWQLLPLLQLQNWTPRPSTNSLMTSDPSFRRRSP